MIEFVPTGDMATVRSILADPRIFHQSANDATPDLEKFTPAVLPELNYVLMIDEGEPIGVVVLKDIPSEIPTAEVHFAFSPSRWGRTRSTGMKCINWIWRKTKLKALMGPVPSYNPLALKFAKAVGFEHLGVQREAGTKHGQPFDINIMAIRRPQ